MRKKNRRNGRVNDAEHFGQTPPMGGQASDGALTPFEGTKADDSEAAMRRGGLEALMRDVEPWPEPVDGAELLNELSQLLSRHVVLPMFAADMLALWIVHTYAFELRDVGTYIGVESPEKRCGKTTLLTVLSKLARRAVVAANISAPAFFRVIEEARPTLLIDEADTFLRGNDEIRGILNAGYLRETAYVLRVTPRGMEGGTAGGGNEAGLGVFSCWCPKVMCLIGRLPETLADRCIVIRMQRKLAGENCERLRRLVTEEVRRKCARFVQDHANAIATNEPPVPESLHDRAGDIWEPLLALAEIAGADWPERARQSAIGLTNSAQENCPIGTLLLDAHVLFLELKVERIFSRDMAAKLNGYSNRPWNEGIKGKLVTDTWLARLLRPYGIRPSTMRIGEEVGRGYEAEDFVQAIQRYVPKAELKGMLSEARTPQKLEVKAPTGDRPPPVEADPANGQSESV